MDEDKENQVAEVASQDRLRHREWVRPTSPCWRGSGRPSLWELPAPIPQGRATGELQQTLNTEGAWPWYFSWAVFRMGMRFWKVGRNEASAFQHFFMRR